MRSLRSRLLWIAISWVTLAAVLIFAVVEFLGFRSLRRDLVSKIEQTVVINSQVLATPFWYLDTDNIEAALDAILRDTDIVAVAALQVDGEVIARRGLPESALDPRFLLSRTVVYHQGETEHEVGRLAVHYTEARIGRILWKRVSVDLLLFLLLLFALAGSISIASHRALGIPIARLLASIREGKRTKLRQPVDWESEDELGLLIREYNEMLTLQASAEAETRRKSALLEATLESIGQGVCVFDREMRLVEFNRRYVELLGHGAEGPVLGERLEDVVRQNAVRGEYGLVEIDSVVEQRLSMAGLAREHRYERERPDGTVVEVHSNPMPQGGFVTTYTDITERKQYEARMRHLALHDGLTNLPNRTLFHDRLRQALASAARMQDRLAVHLIDLDRFKDVNDTMGHDAGDRLLQAVAERLLHAVRASDTAARLGGDEFAIIQSNLTAVEHAAILAQSLLKVMEDPIEIDGRSLHVSASIGVTVYPEDHTDPEELLKNADLAMYAAKAEGRNCYRYFVPEMNRRVRERKALEDDLHRALAQDELVVYYQPRLALASESLLGVEALVRWQHPERGLIPPRDFIPVAEESGLIVPLTEWVLGSACAQGRAWKEQGFNGFRIAVNLSPRHFRTDGVVDRIVRTVERAGLECGDLELEITETALLEAQARAREILAELRALGVAVSLDDFGTGYSSLSYLRRFPIDSIKIDRSFVRDLGETAEAESIVRAVIGLGRSLDLAIVAEGVENEAQLRVLRREACDQVQGYYYSRPVPAEELLQWVRSRGITVGHTVTSDG